MPLRLYFLTLKTLLFSLLTRVGLGHNVSGPLRLAINTQQTGRVFEDRTHKFKVFWNSCCAKHVQPQK